MIDVGEYRKGTSEWLRGDDVQVGDRLTILDGGYFDDETFTDKSGKGKLYFCTTMRLIRTGEEKKVRLGSENVNRIAEKFGSDTASWVGKEVVVSEVKLYKGLKQKGIIFKPGAETTAPNRPTEPVAYLKTVIFEAMKPSQLYPRMKLAEFGKVDAWAEDALIEQAINGLLEEGKIRPKFEALNLVGFTKV